MSKDELIIPADSILFNISVTKLSIQYFIRNYLYQNIYNYLHLNNYNFEIVKKQIELICSIPCSTSYTPRVGSEPGVTGPIFYM